jgi:hypothetical protein
MVGRPPNLEAGSGTDFGTAGAEPGIAVPAEVGSAACG